MKVCILIVGLSCAAAGVQAQETQKAFQERVFETAATPVDTRIPILCGGLYSALAVLFEDEAQSVATFRARVDTARTIGTAVHLMDTSSSDKAEAEQFIDTRMALVSDVFSDWFAFNQGADGEAVSDGVRQNYAFCEGHHEDWTTVRK